MVVGERAGDEEMYPFGWADGPFTAVVITISAVLSQLIVATTCTSTASYSNATNVITPSVSIFYGAIVVSISGARASGLGWAAPCYGINIYITR